MYSDYLTYQEGVHPFAPFRCRTFVQPTIGGSRPGLVMDKDGGAEIEIGRLEVIEEGVWCLDWVGERHYYTMF